MATSSTKILVTGASGFVAIALGCDYTVSTQHARKILSWKPRPKEETIIEMAESMIEQGLV